MRDFAAGQKMAPLGCVWGMRMNERIELKWKFRNLTGRFRFVMPTNYAIVATGGKQYRVRPGDAIDVERIDQPEGDVIVLNDVLLTCVDGRIETGTPLVAGAQVTARVELHGRGKKKTVFKYKNKIRYRRKRGHRQHFTRLVVNDIEA